MKILVVERLRHRRYSGTRVQKRSGLDAMNKHSSFRGVADQRCRATPTLTSLAVSFALRRTIVVPARVLHVDGTITPHVTQLAATETVNRRKVVVSRP